ncbi:cation:proton antiporter domain-containing protein [Hydrogenophaga pseudoflava]|uniref:cation:proton antiporter domain-containing protein n=1 Tax=Hydrogenophaga pseudoflava TaxID=47421 RepID=UPI0027E4F7C8|nr:cation:proton antiporter [Hydrogenophaga pseudoflava]MDQ7744357.1 cation:proton antiporter [Hydrogenophaga pseudoflava]
MVTAALILLGAALLALALVDRAVRRLPLTPALLYLAAGWCAGAGLSAFNASPSPKMLEDHLPAVVLATEAAVLLSLMAVGLRLRVPPRLARWRVALLLAGPGMVATVALGSVAAAMVLDLPWPAALLLAAVLAPTDPVLASEVQIRSEADRDAVRVSLTAEGGLNDGSALPAVMLGLGLMGLHELGAWGGRWVLMDIVWAVGGGLVLGLLLGAGLGRLLSQRVRRGEGLARDELLYVGTVLLGFGLARWLHCSTFVVVFAAAAVLLSADEAPSSAPPGTRSLEDTDLAQRMQAVGARIERLVEAATVLAVGVALHSVPITAPMLAFGVLLVLVVRPLAVLAVVQRQGLTTSQRRLLAWFGIRGVGTLFYLAYALEHGITGELAQQLTGAALVAISLSIVLHGVSSTPLMERYQRRRGSSA